MLKKRLNTEEKYGLTGEQIQEAERYLRQHKTAGSINKQDAMPVYELFLLGYSFDDLNAKFPQYSRPKITLTAALNGWIKDREKLANSVYDRIRARIIKSTIEQVEFLTDMVSVSTVENTEDMKKYLKDPSNNAPPSMRIKNLKEYQQVLDMLSKVTESVRSVSAPQQEARPQLSSKGSKRNINNNEETMLLAELVKVDSDD